MEQTPEHLAKVAFKEVKSSVKLLPSSDLGNHFEDEENNFSCGFSTNSACDGDFFSENKEEVNWNNIIKHLLDEMKNENSASSADSSRSNSKVPNKCQELELVEKNEVDKGREINSGVPTQDFLKISSETCEIGEKEDGCCSDIEFEKSGDMHTEAIDNSLPDDLKNVNSIKRDGKREIMFEDFFKETFHKNTMKDENENACFSSIQLEKNGNIHRESLENSIADAITDLRNTSPKSCKVLLSKTSVDKYLSELKGKKTKQKKENISVNLNNQERRMSEEVENKTSEACRSFVVKKCISVTFEKNSKNIDVKDTPNTTSLYSYDLVPEVSEDNKTYTKSNLTKPCKVLLSRLCVNKYLPNTDYFKQSNLNFSKPDAARDKNCRSKEKYNIENESNCFASKHSENYDEETDQDIKNSEQSSFHLPANFVPTADSEISMKISSCQKAAEGLSLQPKYDEGDEVLKSRVDEKNYLEREKDEMFSTYSSEIHKINSKISTTTANEIERNMQIEPIKSPIADELRNLVDNDNDIEGLKFGSMNICVLQKPEPLERKRTEVRETDSKTEVSFKDATDIICENTIEQVKKEYKLKSNIQCEKNSCKSMESVKDFVTDGIEDLTGNTSHEPELLQGKRKKVRKVDGKTEVSSEGSAEIPFKKSRKDKTNHIQCEKINSKSTELNSSSFSDDMEIFESSSKNHGCVFQEVEKTKVRKGEVSLEDLTEVPSKKTDEKDKESREFSVIQCEKNSSKLNNSNKSSGTDDIKDFQNGSIDNGNKNEINKNDQFSNYNKTETKTKHSSRKNKYFESSVSECILQESIAAQESFDAAVMHNKDRNSYSLFTSSFSFEKTMRNTSALTLSMQVGEKEIMSKYGLKPCHVLLEKLKFDKQLLQEIAEAYAPKKESQSVKRKFFQKEPVRKKEVMNTLKYSIQDDFASSKAFSYEMNKNDKESDDYSFPSLFSLLENSQIFIKPCLIRIQQLNVHNLKHLESEENIKINISDECKAFKDECSKNCSTTNHTTMDCEAGSLSASSTFNSSMKEVFQDKASTSTSLKRKSHLAKYSKKKKTQNSTDAVNSSLRKKTENSTDVVMPTLTKETENSADIVNSSLKSCDQWTDCDSEEWTISFKKQNFVNSKGEKMSKFSCIQCSRELGSAEELFYHLCKGKRKEGILCEFCERVFDNCCTFTSHKISHYIK